MPKLRLFSLALVLLLSSSVFADEAIAEIRAAYQQTYKAAQMKFYYGMYSHRSADFQAFDVDGIEVDPQAELEASQRILKTALEINEKGSVNSYSYLPDGKIECDVTDVIEAVTVDGAIPISKQKTIIKTHSLDTWVSTKHGWKLQKSHLLEQSIIHQPLKP